MAPTPTVMKGIVGVLRHNCEETSLLGLWQHISQEEMKGAVAEVS